MGFVALPVAADAFFKGNAAVAFVAVLLAGQLAAAVGLAFLLRRLHRHAAAWWRWPAVVGSWLLLLGCAVAVAQLGYALLTGEV
jgi:hypothetical protein